MFLAFSLEAASQMDISFGSEHIVLFWCLLSDTICQRLATDAAMQQALEFKAEISTPHPGATNTFGGRREPGMPMVGARRRQL